MKQMRIARIPYAPRAFPGRSRHPKDPAVYCSRTNASRSDVRPEQFERRVRLVSAIARGRRWLNDVVSGRVTTVAELCAREQCSVRQVNMTVSLAFLAPDLVKAAVEGRLPGVSVSSDCATSPRNGADSSKRSDSNPADREERLSPGEDQPSLACARKDSQTVRTVEPVVLRAARSAWAFAASFSG